MHVSNPDALLSHSRMNPVNGSAHHNLAGPAASTLRSEVHESRTLTPAISDLEISNSSFPRTEKEDDQTEVTQLPLYNLAPNQPQVKREPVWSGPHISYGDIKSNAHLGDPKSLNHQRYPASESSTYSLSDDDSSFGKLYPVVCNADALGKYESNTTWLSSQNWDSSSQWAPDRRHYTPSIQLGDDTSAGAQFTQESADDTRMSYNCNKSSPREAWNLGRPYTSLLGVPHLCFPSTSPKLSIISDAGDQQQLRQKRTLLQPEDSFEDDDGIAQSLASLPPLGSRHELQEKIMSARQLTRNNEGQLRKFIPKEELCRVVNIESVTQELMRELLQVHSLEQIGSYAKTVCEEMETKEMRRGKAKIKSFRKIFALLVLVEAASSIIRFLADDVSDQDLPLTLVRSHGTNELYRKGDQNKVPLKCFEHEMWSPVKLENFQEYQWWLLAPFFSPGEDGVVKHYVLQDEHILPLVAPDVPEDHATEKTGGFGKVFMVRIHPDHHNFRDERLCERGFAIKQQLYDHDRETFKREIKILMKFSGERSHRHVVSLLATYEQFKKYNLVFYRAEGDLFEYWRKLRPRPDIDYGNVLWVAEQCRGIAEGLSKLHKLLSFTKRQADEEEAQLGDTNDISDEDAVQIKKHVRMRISVQDRAGTDSSLLSNGVKERATSPIKIPDQRGEGYPTRGHRFHGDEDARFKQYGRHGDINPGNILWYDDSDGDERTLKGTLKIADFGQAELNSLLSRTKPRSVANTMTYRPPECDLNPKIIRQSYDMWCLGCVYLEFVTWLLGGNQLLTRFAKMRLAPDVFQYNEPSDTFFQVVRNQETHNPEFMIKPAVVQFINELHRNPNCTEYLHELLNMIQNDMLVVESSDRKSCAGIWRRLDDMFRRCHEKKDYATTRNPWCIRNEPVSRSVELGMTSDAEQVIEKNLPRRLATPVPPTPAPADQPVAPRKRRASRIPRRSLR